MKRYRRSYVKTTVVAGATACVSAAMLFVWLSRGCEALDCKDHYLFVAGFGAILLVVTIFFVVVATGGALALYYDGKSRARW